MVKKKLKRNKTKIFIDPRAVVKSEAMLLLILCYINSQIILAYYLVSWSMILVPSEVSFL